MKIALLGIRGVPASYGGFETAAEQLGQRLVKRGHQVTVYCRSHHISFPEAHYLGMELVKIPTIKNKYLDTIVHSFLSSLHALFKKYDIALYFIVGNSPVTWIPRIVGTKTIINVDGLDWKREKWPSFAKRYLIFTEQLATKFPNIALTDSRTVQKYYHERYHRIIPYIPYGSELDVLPPGKTLKRFGLESRKYVLFVGRLVPENRAHHLIEAFQGLDTDYKCVIVGDAPYSKDYIATLKTIGNIDSRIVFTGYVFGEGYQELSSNAYIFVESSKASGTHPALTEAMAMGNCIIVNNIPENLETLGRAGFYYSDEEGAIGLRQTLNYLLHNPDVVEDYRKKAYSRAKQKYSWEKVTDEYERLFYKITDNNIPEQLIEMK
ncbi:MAG: DUF1972 domain-containing protein [Anaerolineales bacterium]